MTTIKSAQGTSATIEINRITSGAGGDWYITVRDIDGSRAGISTNAAELLQALDAVPKHVGAWIDQYDAMKARAEAAEAKLTEAAKPAVDYVHEKQYTLDYSNLERHAIRLVVRDLGVEKERADYAEAELAERESKTDWDKLDAEALALANAAWGTEHDQLTGAWLESWREVAFKARELHAKES